MRAFGLSLSGGVLLAKKPGLIPNYGLIANTDQRRALENENAEDDSKKCKNSHKDRERTNRGSEFLRHCDRNES
jgi:hypothetical protein